MTSPGAESGILRAENAVRLGGYFVMDDRAVVFANNVDTEFLFNVNNCIGSHRTSSQTYNHVFTLQLVGLTLNPFG